MSQAETTPGRLIVVLGEAGAGKSTLLRAYVAERYIASVERYQPLLHTHLTGAGQSAIVFGRLDGDYPGTDALPHDATGAALRLLADRPAPVVYAEGLRLATGAFWRGALARGYTPLVVWLSVPPRVAEARIRERDRPAGDAADPAWRERQRRRVRRLGQRHAVAVLNGRESIATLTAQFGHIVADGSQP